MSRIATIALTIAVFISSIPSAEAQTSIAYGSVGGQVIDPSGLPVAGASVALRRVETNASLRSTTGSDGRFQFSLLPPGEYEASFDHPGFSKSIQPVHLNAGAGFEIQIHLQIATPGQSVTVKGEAPLVESGRTEVASTVDQAELTSLPLNGRSFLDAALVVPGVSPTNTASNQLFAETSAVPGQGISVSSQRNFSNSFLVDGLSANDDAAGLSGVFYGLGALDQMQVVTSGGQAELGRALGGYVNASTHSGTNSMHGDIYGFFRNQRLNAANPLSNTKLPMTQAQYGASLGGPIVKDRFFYFANFEQRQLNQSGLTTIDPANVAIINTRLAQVGYPGLPLATGIYPNPVHASNGLARADYNAGRSRSFLRYSLYDVNSHNSRGAGALSAPSASAHLEDRDQTIAAANIFEISPRTVNELRGQFTLSNLAAPPSDLVGPAVSISGIASFGTLSGSPTARNNKLAEVVDNLSYQTGAHLLRVGVDFLYNDTTITYPRSNRGSYTFSSLANFLSGTYNNAGYAQTFGQSVIGQTNPNVGFYAQDEWKISSRLVLNAGLRYDLQWLDSLHTDKNNVSPRAGLAYTPFASRHTVIRASYGLFYDRLPLRALANALLSANNTTDLTQLRQIGISLSPTQAGAPVFPAILPAAIPLTTLVNFSTMDPNMKNAYSEQASFEVEQQLGAHSTLSAGFSHLRGLHLIVSVNQNVPTCVAAGTNNGCRPNPNYGNNSQYSSLADSNYNGLHVSFTQRMGRRATWRVSYAYSKSLDNVGEFFFSSPIDPTNIWRDYGRSDDDQRHRLTFNGTARLVKGFELSALMQYYSALPLNITSGVTTIQGTAGRPIVNGDFIGRNVGIGNDFFNANIRLSRTFRLTEALRLEALAEAFNALNHRNNLTKNGNFGSGAYPTNPSTTFGQVTAVNDPRGVQLALRLRF